MLVAAAVVPHPPLLVPEVSVGAAHETSVMRSVVDSTVAGLLARRPQTVVVVAAGDAARTQDDAATPTLAPYGLRSWPGPARRAPGNDPLGLGHSIGAWLLDRAGWTGGRRYETVTGDALVLPPGRVALLVTADGSARRSAEAPGHLDPRAEPFDAVTTRALAGGDLDALESIDVGLAEELWASGATALRTLARTVRTQQGAAIEARVDHDAAPYGVGYVCATWTIRVGAEE
ncbi:hypothetical protein [Solicola sp. PLA-1-18]|uniref:hypothetical protein n=1 Tax=Solicola sp. PLA-1-18 TaxID=3380532 RepID=UPI003B818425